MPSAPKFNNSALTKELRARATVVHTITDDGTPITREQALTEWIWKQALGWVEVIRDDHGNRKEIRHEPVGRWAEFVFERLEGKAAPASASDTTERVSAADKVRELSRERLNKLAASK